MKINNFLFYLPFFITFVISTKTSIPISDITALKYSSYNLFYQKIYNDLILFNSDILPNNNFQSFTDRGIPVPNDFFDFSDGSNLIEFSKLVDIIPNTKGPFIIPTEMTTTPNYLSEAFLQILNNATFSFNSPVNPLSTQQKRHLQNIFNDFKINYDNGTINDSDIIKKCLIYRNTMNILVSNFQIFEEFILTDDATEQDIEEFSKIEEDWNDINEYFNSKSQIYCHQIDTDNSFIKQYTGYSSSYYIDFIKESMNGSIKLDTTYSEYFNTTYYPSFYYPTNFLKFNDQNITLFTKFVFNQTNDYNFNVNTSYIGLNENKISNFNLELIDDSQSFVNIDDTGMEISFEISTIPIHRPWFDENELNDQGYYSDGSLGGIIGIYTNGIIIAKNISITLNTTNNQINQNAINQLLISKTAYFGSLFIKGSVNGMSSEETTPIIINGSTIYLASTQIIGFKCSVLPILPNYNNNPTTTPSITTTTSSITSSSSSSSSTTTTPSQKTSLASLTIINIKLLLLLLLIIGLIL
ncbi:hypothetical protein ACTA71_012626 [Dictyostelium dimigraforme]